MTYAASAFGLSHAATFRASRRKPFFVYFAPGATHAPHHVQPVAAVPDADDVVRILRDPSGRPGNTGVRQSVPPW